ncbi:MAG TPA: trehalase family glycosidase [Verrucomicrobiae bacterium]|nr:trehalase family glycosidase [Verrucomicrobiae bacterium]
MRKIQSCFIFVALLAAISGLSQTISIPDNFARLAAQEDTDSDKKITVHDHVTPFEIRGTNGATVETISDEYQLSILLQHLKRAEDSGHFKIPLNEIPFNESIVDRTHRLIKTYYWNALTRQIDAAHVDEVVHDPKVQSKFDYIYVPAADTNAVGYFKSIEAAENKRGRSPALKVVLLPSPEKINGQFVRDLNGEHGILSLALETNADGKISGVPYVVPGGRFNELYCWDSYFITLGLLHDGRKDLARGMADNLLYEVRYYGKIPNANRTYYLTRSQPPFLTSIIRAVYDSGAADKAWLARALKTATFEYEYVWMNSDRLVKIGDYELNRYYGEGDGPCPEVEVGHYDEKIQPWLEQANTGRTNALTPFRFLNEFLYCDAFSDLKVNGMTLSEFFKNDRAVRESGHDTTHRFDDRTTDYLPVDLNSLLYKYETDFAEILETQFGGKLPELGKDFGDANFWRQQAAKRKHAMMALMWDDKRGFFFDYDFVNKKRSDYISATGIYPLWAKTLDANNSGEKEIANRMISFAKEKLEERFGLAATARESVESARTHDARQWDYPFGWAPHQMLAWQGFKNYGFDSDADELAYRWLYAIAKNAHDFDGVIPEKYNVVTGSHDVFVEYGNVGTKFDYIAPEGFGWMNASFEIGLNYLTPDRLADLKALKPPTD